MLNPGTYRIRVRPVGAWVQAMPYRVRARMPPRAVVVLSSSGWNEFPTQPRVVGEVLEQHGPGTGAAAGRLRDPDFLPMPPITSSGRVSPMHAGSGSVPASARCSCGVETIPGYHHHEVEVTDAPLASLPPFTGLEVHPSGTSDHGFGVLSYDGTLENTTGVTVTVPRALVTILRAVVCGTRTSATDVEPLGPFESSSFMRA